MMGAGAHRPWRFRFPGPAARRPEAVPPDRAGASADRFGVVVPGKPDGMMRKVIAGAAAGAAGTTALNAATYTDMVLRGRGGSSTPEETVERLSDATDIPVPGEGEMRNNRLSGLGAMLGMATGVGVGALYGAARALPWKPPFPVAALANGLAAMAGSNLPMVALKVTDPRTWRPADWLADLVPHLAYGAATAAVWEAAAPGRPSGRMRRRRGCCR